jgi:hypothetical protein
VRRLSLIYAVLDRSEAIDRCHLEAALALWRYVEASTAYVFAGMLGNRDAERILAELRHRPDGMTRTEISDLFRGHRSEAQIEEALELLLRMGLARKEVRPTGGRPVERWFATTAKKAEKGSTAGAFSASSAFSAPSLRSNGATSEAADDGDATEHEGLL